VTWTDPDRQARHREGDLDIALVRFTACPARAGRRGREDGARFTYFELLATSSSDDPGLAILPTAKVLRKRQKEIELRPVAAHRPDRPSTATMTPCARAHRGTDVQVGSEGYPPDLDVLVKGVSQWEDRREAEFLRRAAVDP